MSQTSYFANACGFVIENGNFSTVHGNQIIHNNQRIYHDSHKRERTEYDDYNQVISGNIRRTKDFGVYRWNYDRRTCLRVNKTICAAEVMGMEGKTFTVVAYSGPEAREEFERDFRKYSGQLTASSFQVYGVNADVPLVLFHNELRPLASFVDSVGFWGRFYLTSWVEHHLGWHDRSREVWVDSTKGILCRGLPGPERLVVTDFFIFENVPSDIEFLRDDVCFRFLASLKSKDVDLAVVRAISRIDEDYEDGAPNVHQPTVFSISTNTIITVGTAEWRRGRGLEDREVMENGESRFTLGCEEGSTNVFTLYHDTDVNEEWLSQASSVFHALGISLDSDLSDYEVTAPHLCLDGYLSNSQEARRRRRQQPIYLFVHPPDSSTPTERCKTSSLHHWSFNPSGQPPLSTVTCDLLGLAVQLDLQFCRPDRFSWPNTAYKQIHEYQIARGFDPTTPDFARSLGFPIYQVQHDSHRFEEVGDAATTASSSTLSAVTPLKEASSKPSTIDSNPILLTPIWPDPTLEASYAVFASGSNTIPPESTSNSLLGDWSSGYSQRNTQPPPLPHGVSPPFNDRHLHAAGASAVAYTTPIHSHASHAGFDFSFGATYLNTCTGWNPNPLRSGLPYGQSLSPPPTVSPLEPSTAYSIPSSYPNTSEALQGWNTTDTPSLKRKERDTFYPDAFLQGHTKRPRLLETSESDATWSLWPAQEAECGASLGNLEGGVAADVRGMQTYGSSEGMGGLVTQTNEPEDEIRRLREENERLRRMLEISGSKNVA